MALRAEETDPLLRPRGGETRQDDYLPAGNAIVEEGTHHGGISGHEATTREADDDLKTELKTATLLQIIAVLAIGALRLPSPQPTVCMFSLTDPGAVE
jgi:hypothetical protein